MGGEEEEKGEKVARTDASFRLSSCFFFARHHASDIIAGSLLGLVIGWYSYRQYELSLLVLPSFSKLSPHSVISLQSLFIQTTPNSPTLSATDRTPLASLETKRIPISKELPQTSLKRSESTLRTHLPSVRTAISSSDLERGFFSRSIKARSEGS